MWNKVVLGMCLLQAVLAVKVKVVLHSDEDSRVEDEEYRTETWEKKKATIMPFIRHHKREEEVTTEKAKPLHPNELIFPLIYKQSHINSMFKFGESWYTWSVDQRPDGSTALSYYICYDDPKRCDEIGWERTEAVPRCAFQIDSLLPDDRVCLNAFGVEPHSPGTCDGSDQMKMSDLTKACGLRIRSLWRFVRAGKRPATASKPADVNSLVCEDEDECYISIEYRIHHDRITFSLHEPTRGQTFKSSLKREIVTEEESKAPSIAEAHVHTVRRAKKPKQEVRVSKKFRVKPRPKTSEGKGIVKDSESGYQRTIRNKIKIREDISDDVSD